MYIYLVYRCVTCVVYDIESMSYMYVVHKSLCHTYIPHIVFYIYFDLPYVWHAYVWHRIHIVCTCMLEFYTYMYVCKKFQEAYINVSMKVYMIHTCTCMWMLSTNLVRNGKLDQDIFGWLEKKSWLYLISKIFCVISVVKEVRRAASIVRTRKTTLTSITPSQTGQFTILTFHFDLRNECVLKKK